MTARTYIELFEPQIILSIHRSQGGWYAVTDQHGRLFTPPVDLGFALRFMQAMAEKRDALIDDASVERAAWQHTGEGEPQSGAAACAEDTSSFSGSASVSHPGPSPSPVPEFSVRVDNVVPIR